MDKIQHFSLNSPIARAARIPVLIIVGYLILLWYRGELLLSIIPIFFGGFVGIFFLLLWLFFFSQFVLPVRTINERIQVFKRILLYSVGKHGPAIFIENGEIRPPSKEAKPTPEKRSKRKKDENKSESNPEIKRRGPGVIVLDTASAALLRTATKFTRAVGPGVAFTEINEFLGGRVDLHLQNSKLGPREKEDPFAPKAESETEPAYKSRQNRRFEIRGFTRDGIEVVPIIQVSFRLDAQSGEGFTHFGYNPTSVELAIIGRPIKHKPPPLIQEAERDSKERGINLQEISSQNQEANEEWKQIPAYLAVDIWRECINKFTFTDLFHFIPNKPGAMRIILNQVKSRLQKPFSKHLDEFGNEAVEETENKEFLILRDRGLRVEDVAILNLCLPISVDEQLIQRWKATWLIRALQEKEAIESQRSYVSTLGQEMAFLDFAESSSHFLGAISPQGQKTGKQIAKLLLEGNLYLCNRNPQLHQLSINEIDQLTEILNWIEKG